MSNFILVPGKLRAGIYASLLRFLAQLPDSKPWEVTVKRYVKSRTNDQNAALFGVAYKALTAETGFTADELHDAMCKRFFGTVEREVFGEIQRKPFRTTTMDENGKRDVLPWDRFSEFYAMVQQVGAEAGIFVPDPDKFWRERQEEAA